jgi:2-polyprenyl-3-methyl-5-hydroxy-6-metoxy-1,4-benzoquinol methylase
VHILNNSNLVTSKLETIMEDELYKEINSEGERVTHLYPNDCFYAHLSIYYFATQFCRNCFVLDAGSGAGYGSAYLVDHGARFVDAIEISEESVAFSNYHFKRPNLHYQVNDLNNLVGFQSHSFDLIFSSNVLEHVSDVVNFIHTAWKILKPDGMMIVAVPPIVREVDWAENIANIYHHNIWTPRQWYQVFNQFFGEIDCFWHGLRPGLPLDFHNKPEQTIINEKDFIFKPVPVDHYYLEPSLSILFIIREPRLESEIPPAGQPVTFIENSFTRPLSFQTASFSAILARLSAVRSNLFHLGTRTRTIARQQGILSIFTAAIHHIKWRINRRHERNG